MATEQIEHHFDGLRRRHRHNSRSRRWEKKCKLRKERRRSKRDPQCVPLYRKYKGWEY